MHPVPPEETPQVPQGIDGGGANLSGDLPNPGILPSPEVLESPSEDADEFLKLAIEEQMALINPVLNEIFKYEAEGRALWLKKKSLSLLVHWIRTLLDIANVNEQKMEKMTEVMQAQEQELMQLRPDEGGIFIPTIY